MKNNLFYTECYSLNGDLKWREKGTNLITTEGLIYILNMSFCFLDKSNYFSDIKGENYGIYTTLSLFLYSASPADPTSAWTYTGIGTQCTEFTTYGLWDGNNYDNEDQRISMPCGFTLDDGFIAGHNTVEIKTGGSIKGICVVAGDEKDDNSYEHGKMIHAAQYSSTYTVSIGDMLQVGMYVYIKNS